MKLTFLNLLLLISVNSVAQEYIHDTVSFSGYIGIISDSSYAPYGSRNIFPKNRFKPTIQQVQEFERQLWLQYRSAKEKFERLSFENMKQAQSAWPKREWRKIKKQHKRKVEKGGGKDLERLRKEFDDFDRIYYGYIGKNGFRYIRVEFTPHQRKYFSSGGESHLVNYPPLVYNLDRFVLSLAGWTGEGDD